MENKFRVKLLEYWRENLDKVSKIPDDIKDKVSEKEASNLLDELGNNITLEVLSNKIDKIKTEMSEDAQLKINERMEDHNRNLVKLNKQLLFIQFFSVAAATMVGVASLYITSQIGLYQSLIQTNQYTLQKDALSSKIFPELPYCPSYNALAMDFTPTFWNLGQSFGTVIFTSDSYNSSIDNLTYAYAIREKGNMTFEFDIFPNQNVSNFGFSILAVTDNKNHCYLINCSYIQKGGWYETEKYESWKSIRCPT